MIGDASKIGGIIAHGSLDEALKCLLLLATKENSSDAIQELESISGTYHLMKQYMLDAVEDVRRGQIYGDLKSKAYSVLSRLVTKAVCRDNVTLAGAKKMLAAHPVTLDEICDRLEWIAQELIVNSLSGENNGKSMKLHDELHDCRQSLFNYLITSCSLSQSEEETICKILFSSYADMANARIVISALMLAQHFVFDIRKFNILAKICTEGDNEEMRQYALVAFVIAKPDPIAGEIYKDEIDKAFGALASLPHVKDELAELQMQIILCTDTEQTNKTIADEIMPSIKENAALLQAKKTEKEMLDELLHPDKEESSMDKVEKSIEKIRDMQKKGADIFFGGFSQAKRFSFFYTLMNWFVPFSMEHPQIASIDLGNIPKNEMGKILDMQPLCSSDKYSFCLALSTVYSQIPKEMIDVIAKGEAVMGFDGMVTKDNSFARLMYLQDLYRFYKLYHRKTDFADPFETDDSVVFFNWDKMVELFRDTDYPFKIARQLLSRNRFSALGRLLDNNKDERNTSYLKLRALSEYKQKHYNSALYWFEKVQAIEPDNRILLKRTADTCFLAGDFGRAEELYEDYVKGSEASDDSDFENYRLSLCYLENDKTDAAKSILFRLNFEQETNADYKSALALAHIKSNDYEKALSMYGNINGTELDVQDRIRKSIVCWITGRKAEAVEELRKWVLATQIPVSDLYARIRKEQKDCHIELDDTELKIFVDIVYDQTIGIN